MTIIKSLSIIITALFLATSTASAAPNTGPVDDGTGYYGAGSQTGGPSGGLPNRN